MIDWNGRIDELMAALGRWYGIDDREVVEAMLSVLVDCPRTERPRLALETNWYARNCERGWFALGGSWPEGIPWSLARLRVRSRLRQTELQVEKWLETPDEACLFIEPEWEHFRFSVVLGQYRFLMQQVLRLRLPVKRMGYVLEQLEGHNQNRIADEIRSKTKAVLDDRAHSRPTNPPKFHPPGDFLYHLELLQRLSPFLTDWDTLVGMFGELAVRHAYLMGRTETNEEDIRILARVARDSVPYWMEQTIRQLDAQPTRLAALALHMFPPYMYMSSSPGTKGNNFTASAELRRLRRKGMVEWDKTDPRLWRLHKDHKAGLHALVNGGAFGVGRAVTAAHPSYR